MSLDAGSWPMLTSWSGGRWGRPRSSTSRWPGAVSPMRAERWGGFHVPGLAAGDCPGLAVAGPANGRAHTPGMSYVATARAVADLVGRVPHDAWDGPGLGDWTVRDLVGHTSRSLVTVVEYFARPVEDEKLADPVDYYVAIRSLTMDAAAITERGRQAGRDLGTDPAARFAELVDEASAVVDRTDPDLVVHTIAGGMRAAAYLPTRTFELVVHGIDIAHATGLDVDLPVESIEEAASLAARVAARTGRGAELLLALTGRRALPDGFSIV